MLPAWRWGGKRLDRGSGLCGRGRNRDADLWGVSRGRSAGLSLRPCRVPQIPVDLEAEPELWRSVQEFREPERCVRRDAPPAANDLIQPIQRNPHLPRGLDLR